ncbi:MAG: alpha/beta hydrolase [Alkalimonas sp.]|nr:alpha/beta hydrolase [Alkalimonas sp.]
MADTGDIGSQQASGMRWLWRIVAVVSIMVTACILLLIAGAMRDPTRSMHGMIGSAIWTTFGPHLFMFGFLCIVLSILSYRCGARRLSAIALPLAVVACAGSAFITFSIVSATYSAGGAANPISGLWLRPMEGDGPDHEIVFSEVNGQELRVAIYRAKQTGGEAPVMIYIHGGGFMIGSNVETDADLRWFADRGWLVFSVDYRLWTNEVASWDLAPQDVACAAAWVGQNAAAYGGTIERLALLGDSAGGNLAINYSYAAAQEQLESDCAGELPIPKAVIVQYPAVDPLAIYEHGFPVPGFEPEMLVRGYLGGEPNRYPDRVHRVSSYTYLSAHAPSTLILSPEKDGLVPSWSVYRFADYARLAGVDVELVRIPFASHVYNQLASNSIGNQARLSITERFLTEQGLAPITGSRASD